MRPFLRIPMAFLIVMILVPSTAHAMFGEENLLLGQIIASLSEQWEVLKRTANYVRENVGYARQSATFAHEAVQVSKNVNYLRHHPKDFLQQSSHSWDSSFPYGREILGDVYGIESELSSIRHMNELPEYDAYAYAEALKGLKRFENRRYEVMVRRANPDDLGVHASHDDALKALHMQHNAALDNLSELDMQLRTVGLSPARAPLYTARATSVAAAAQVRAAATLQSIKRDADLTLIKSERDRSQANQAYRQQKKEISEMKHSWRLDPLGLRSQAEHP